MKRICAIILVLTLVLTMAACGGPNVDELSAKYDAFQDKYNGMLDVVEATGWINDDDVYYSLEEIPETMLTYKDAIENPGNYTQETVDQMCENLDALLIWVDELLPLVSEPYVG